MRNLLLFLLGVVMFFGCSSTPAVDAWRYKSATALKHYEQNFLQKNETMARFYLQRALKWAKQSADLETLARVYLSECALHRAVGKESGCREYQEVAQLQSSEQNNAYYLLLQGKIEQKDIEKLPQRYKAFAISLTQGDIQKAQKEALEIDDDVSRYIAVAIIAKYVDNTTREKILKLASKRGDKQVVLFWLHQLALHVESAEQKDKILKKIQLLEE